MIPYPLLNLQHGTGFITPEELQAALNGMGDKISFDEAQKLVQNGDIDGDGKLNYEEVTKPYHMLYIYMPS